MTRTPSSAMKRRDALMLMGATFAALPLAHLIGCKDEDDDDTDDGTTERIADASVDGASGGDAATTRDAATTGDGGASAWATGGTAAMLAKASYPNPFTGATGTSCAIACETTIGPCHTTSPLRSDVSDAIDGLPVRLALRIVDPSCQPVSDAIVEIWHTNYSGIYSGRINTMCNTNEVDRAAQYFRGYLRTDADGRVDFDTCFPGWYSSRAVHVHVRVMKGDYASSDTATAWVITQLLFSDTLVGEIFANEPLYAARGQPDTLLASDNVVGGESDKTPYLFDVQRMTDGAMLASKTLVLRASLSDSGCSAQGASGGPVGPGAPP